MFVGNTPVAGFMDEDLKPVQGPIDRSVHTFRVDKAEMIKCFERMKVKVDVQGLVDQFEKAMSR